MKYTCPVCGYNNLEEPPADWSICPCCRTEFGYSDANRSYEELRLAWLNDGGQWRSKRVPKPDGWTATAQLSNLNRDIKPNSVLVVAGKIIDVVATINAQHRSTWLFESTGLALGQQTKEWPDYSPTPLSINLSPTQASSVFDCTQAGRVKSYA